MEEYEVAVVGSGAGGAPLAKELSEEGMKVVVLEKGPRIEIKDAGRYYDRKRSEEGVGVARAICYGGTTTVSFANGGRALEKEFKEIGINLNEEFLEVERELNVKPVPDERIPDGLRSFMETAGDLGFKAVPTPKFIDYEKCPEVCGQCGLGCKHGAKHSAIDYLDKAIEDGAEIVTGFEVSEIMVEKGRTCGVKGSKKMIRAEKVVVSAGALETPRILSRSGIEAGDNLFIDLVSTVGGVFKGADLNKTYPMPALIQCEGFILSPQYDWIYQSLKNKGLDIKPGDVFGVMIKTADEGAGKVNSDGTIDKPITSEDARILCEGAATAFEILSKMGVDPKTITATSIGGAHPGGTASIGKIVDKNLETEIGGLYVCDASVLPVAPGAPPILTIMALSKRLAGYITAKG
jgi:choline dehydrogenase-like flavoprotein